MKRPKIILIMVTTSDGIISKSKDESSYIWTSDEDKAHFRSKISQYKNVIIGNNTFKTLNNKLREGVTYYVLTKNKTLESNNPQVEYIGGNLEDIIENLNAKNIDEIALLGGAEANSLFLKNNLVDEIYLTIEPKLFGQGIYITKGTDLNLNLKLIDQKQLNDQGTLVLHYKVLN